MGLATERAHLDAECTPDEVEQEAAWCQEAMCNVPDATAKNIRISPRPTWWWWNADINKRGKAVRGEERRRRNSEAASREKAELLKWIRQFERKMYSESLQKRKGAELSGAARYVNPWAGSTVEALTHREDKKTNTLLEKEGILRVESYHPNCDDQYDELPRAGMAHMIVTEQSVERALCSRSVKKAPGPDKLMFAATQLLWMADKKRNVRLMLGAICIGRHPAVWKCASGVVIRTPGQDDHTQLKAYRSTPLLGCMPKVVEKVIAELQSEAAERRGRLSDVQFGR